MGRKEDRKFKKLHGEKLGKSRLPSSELNIGPVKMGNEIAIPVNVDDPKGPFSELPGSLTPEEFGKMTQHISDKELNRIIYNNAKMAVREGLMPDKPEDDFGTVMWFAWSFITDEMREIFPAIAREYLDHYETEENGRTAGGLKFENILYPRMQEKTWDDAYFFRVLLMMLYSARGGSSYSKNFLISLYKVYYKYEYNRLKRLDTLTYLDVLESHDEYCVRQGYPSGHTTDGTISFKEMVIEKRKHEPGWTNALGNRTLSPVPGKRKGEARNGDVLNRAAAEIRDMSEAPDEPPIQPTASRLFIMSELMGIRIDPTCNEQALHMNVIADSMGKVVFLNSPEYRKLRNETVERCMGMLKATYPEMFDPYDYQTQENYLSLQVAEQILSDVCKKYDVNYRMLYDSRQFSLPLLVADLTITLQLNFPDLKLSFDEMLVLSMVQYLSEALCELMAVRDDELEEVLHFHRRRNTGEWNREEEPETAGKQADKSLSEKVMRSVENLRSKEDAEQPEPEPDMDEEGLKEENARLKALLADREAALAESEQKVIRQRVLYEKAHEHEQELEKLTDEQAVEHAELIALREYVYGLKNTEYDTAEDLDEQTRDQILDKIKEKKVAVLGGTERWSKRMKKLLPSWSFVSVDDAGTGGFLALERADFIYIYTSALKHSHYYRAMNIVKSQGKMLYYLGSTNVNENLKQFEKELCR